MAAATFGLLVLLDFVRGLADFARGLLAVPLDLEAIDLEPATAISLPQHDSLAAERAAAATAAAARRIIATRANVREDAANQPRPAAHTDALSLSLSFSLPLSLSLARRSGVRTGPRPSDR